MGAQRFLIPLVAIYLLIPILSQGAAIRTRTWNEQAHGITEATLRTLIYGDDIPGFREKPATTDGKGPDIALDIARDEGDFVSSIRSCWESSDGLNRLDITVWTFASPEAAMESGKSLSHRGQFEPTEMPAKEQIGEASWSWPRGNGYGLCRFVLGRTMVEVHIIPWNRRVSPNEQPRVSAMDGHLYEIADTLARGLEWVIRQHRELVSAADTAERLTVQGTGTSTSETPALTLRNVTWASLSALAQAGAQVTWDAKTNSATVS